MIVVDTNVVSELVRPRPDPHVAAWFRAQSRSDLYVSSVTQAEVLYGIEIMPAGNRRTALAREMAATFDIDFAGHVLSVGSDAAKRFAVIAAERRASGHEVGRFDGLIAATAWVSGASVATRDTDDFAGLGVRLINPWTP